MSRKRKRRLGVRQDYNRKKLQNPFFKNKKGRVPSRWLKYILLLILALLIFLIWFFFAAPIWQIKDIKIEGLTRFSDSDIKNYIYQQEEHKRLMLFKQDNIFLFKKDEVWSSLDENYNFSKLEIKKGFPNTIKIIIQERPYSFIFQQGDDYYYASSDGYVLRENAVSEEDKTHYFILENKNQNNLITSSDEINITDDYLSFIQKLHDTLTSQEDLVINRFIIDQEFNTVKVDFKEGPVVFFNTKSDIAEQVNRLALVKKEKIKDNFNRVEYIDLRYGDRIFLYPPIN